MKGLPLVLLLPLLLLPAAAGAFTISLPADSTVKIDAPSRLLFRVGNTESQEGLSRLTLRFPSGYRVAGGSAPPGWTVEGSPKDSGRESAEISFRTTDEAKCTGAIAPGGSLVFGVEVTASASRAVTPDSLVGAQGEQSCRGVALDPPATLPSWDRLGIQAALAAGPPTLGVGGEVTVTLTLTNLSTVELREVAALLHSTGTGGVSRLAGPHPRTLTLGPGASGSLTWTARAASAGTVSFSGQAMSKNVTSPPIRSETLFVGDLEVSLSLTPEQVVSGQEVRVEMTVRNRGPVRVANVIPSSLTLEGTAAASAAAGPTPASLPVLEPGGSATFAWAATIAGKAGDTYAFSGWASAEWGSVVSQSATSNRGALAQQEVARESEKGDESGAVGGGGFASEVGGTAAATASTGGSAAPANPSATLQFIGVNQNGSQTGGTNFSGGVLGDLRILVTWKNLSGTHAQRLELWNPNGFLYQSFSTEFSGTPVETRLPVSGTWITQHSLFGAWRVDVYLDVERTPTTTGAFVLTP